MNKLYPTDNIHHQYVEYPQRWLQLILFLCALLSNIMFGFSLSPIVKEISLVYQVDSRYLQFLTISFTVFSVIMIIPGNILNEKYGVRMSIMIGCALTFIDSIFAIFINVSFWFFFIGQLISLIGFPFRLISASKFVANWFFPENRILIMESLHQFLMQVQEYLLEFHQLFQETFRYTIIQQMIRQNQDVLQLRVQCF
ncbi:unnamed protein product [Paramecium pentaurelia]|uniref:Major facilitator superfamily (MFS) profile domain-containing protein n=1 Tax=Paramecium pentaurelia TaxID=43138 RepID=A0A8S1S6J9_9CILI|nr:unnamed protein product [Paramecium pentaurelia]